jgi:hypothetical protein
VRLWSLHPQYLDARGLVALWREALLAQAVLCRRTRGYRFHPQLQRFREAPSPRAAIAAYLIAIHTEAARHGYRFNAGKIGRGRPRASLPVTRGQLRFELEHLRRKLSRRAPEWQRQLPARAVPRAHPAFRTTSGGVATWEIR